MKNTKVFLYVISMTFFACPVLAQQVVELDPFLGRSINSEEAERLSLMRKLEFQSSSPDSIVFRSLQNGSRYEARGYWANPAHEEFVILKQSKFESIVKSARGQLRRIKKGWEEMAKALEAPQPVLCMIELYNGDLIRGTLLELNNKAVVVAYLGNAMTLPWWELHKVEVLMSEDKSPSEPRNPNATRYLFAPSAIPLQKGEAYYQNVYVGINSINVGVTDHISLSGGVEMFTLLASIFTSNRTFIGFANVKAGWKVGEKIYIGGGAIAGGVLTESEGTVALGYGLATIGDRSTNLTLAVGTGHLNGDFTRAPIIVLGGMHQISPRVGLVTENWFVIQREEQILYNINAQMTQIVRIGKSMDTDAILAFSGGVRLMTNKITFDLALVTLGEAYSRNASVPSYDRRDLYWFPIPIPFLGVVYKF